MKGFCSCVKKHIKKVHTYEDLKPVVDCINEYFPSFENPRSCYMRLFFQTCTRFFSAYRYRESVTSARELVEILLRHARAL